MVLGIDLDEVVFNFIDPFLEFVNKKYNTKYQRHSLSDWSLEESGVIPKGTDSENIHEYGRQGGFKNQEMMPGAKEILDILRLRHQLIFVTNRKKEFIEDTNTSLHKHGYGGYPVFFTGTEHPKFEVVKEQGIELFIDDNPVNISKIFQNTDCWTILMTEITGAIEQAEFDLLAKNWGDVYLNLVKLKTLY